MIGKGKSDHFVADFKAVCVNEGEKEDDEEDQKPWDSGDRLHPVGFSTGEAPWAEDLSPTSARQMQRGGDLAPWSRSFRRTDVLRARRAAREDSDSPRSRRPSLGLSDLGSVDVKFDESMSSLNLEMGMGMELGAIREEDESLCSLRDDDSR